MKGMSATLQIEDERKKRLLEAILSIRNGFAFPQCWETILRNGLDAFETLPIPHAKTEGWRETNLSPFFDPQRKWALNIRKQVSEGNISNDVFKTYPPVIVWENGAIHSQTDRTGLWWINGFKETFHSEYKFILEKVFSAIQEPRHVFEALSDMLMHNGIFLYIPPGTLIEEPIHIAVISKNDDTDTLDVPRVIIYLGDNSQVTVTTHYWAGTTEGLSVWTNAREHIYIGNNAHLKYMNTIQGESNTLRFLSTSIEMEENSTIYFNALHLSGPFIRSEVDVEMKGENAECHINGLTLNQKNHFSETQHLIQHLKGHGTSRIHWRGLGQDRSKTVYQGKIYIAPHAQKSDSIQQFKGLSLSNEAIVDAKPQLEIYADDVRCTHGATVGPPPPDLIYYFRTRGITSDKARSLLIRGFIYQVLKEIPIEKVGEIVNKHINF